MAYKIKNNGEIIGNTSSFSFLTENQGGVLVPCVEKLATFAMDEYGNLFRFVWFKKPIRNKGRFDFQEVTELEEISNEDLFSFRNENGV